MKIPIRYKNEELDFSETIGIIEKLEAPDGNAKCILVNRTSVDLREINMSLASFIEEIGKRYYEVGYAEGTASAKRHDKDLPKSDEELPKGWIKLPCDGVLGHYICNVNNILYLFPYQDYTNDWVTQVAFANSCDTVTVKMQHDALLKMIEKAQEDFLKC